MYMEMLCGPFKRFRQHKHPSQIIKSVVQLLLIAAPPCDQPWQSPQHNLQKGEGKIAKNVLMLA